MNRNHSAYAYRTRTLFEIKALLQGKMPSVSGEYITPDHDAHADAMRNLRNKVDDIGHRCDPLERRADIKRRIDAAAVDNRVCLQVDRYFEVDHVSDRTSKIISATMPHYLSAMGLLCGDLEISVRGVRIAPPAEREPDTSRDLLTEAHENGHPHVIREGAR